MKYEVHYITCATCGDLKHVCQFSDLSNMQKMVVENNVLKDCFPLLKDCISCRAQKRKLEADE